MFKGIEHTAIASPQPERLAQWYVDHLEFRINFSYQGNYFVRAADGSMLEIIPSDSAPATAPGTREKGMRHIAIAVQNFDEGYQQLRQKNVSFDGEPFTNEGNRLVFFRDVDGNLLHLIERSKPLP